MASGCARSCTRKVLVCSSCKNSKIKKQKKKILEAFFQQKVVCVCVSLLSISEKYCKKQKIRKRNLKKIRKIFRLI